MNYKIVLLTTFLFISTFLQAQKLSYAEKSSMVQKSYQVELNSSVLAAAKQYAADHAYEFAIIKKNFIHLRVIYNNKLSTASRIAYCQYLLELWKNDRSSIVEPIIREQIKSLQTKNSTND